MDFKRDRELEEINLTVYQLLAIAYELQKLEVHESDKKDRIEKLENDLKLIAGYDADLYIYDRFVVFFFETMNKDEQTTLLHILDRLKDVKEEDTDMECKENFILAITDHVLVFLDMAVEKNKGK